jgi:signal transduction histidine kinase
MALQSTVLSPWRTLPPLEQAAAPAAYAASAMTMTRLPLATAALHLLGEGGTPDELERRFAEIGVALEHGLPDALLQDLLGLGLARVARTVAGVPFLVPTSLGRKARRHGIAGEAAVGLADLEALRSELLSTIAHELRTPLTSVRTSAGLLADVGSRATQEQRRTLVAAIVRNADRMHRLVSDILDLARFRSGSIRLQPRRFDACELARAVIEAVAPLATARSQRIELRGCDEEIPVFGDHRRLEQALLNLVSNAGRFSPDGVAVIIRVEEHDGFVRWAVVDTGPGIPASDQPRLFERFFVGRSDRSGQREGVGLGLPTALAIAQAHGGTIEVDSAVGRGSIFTLVVPANLQGEGD